MTARSTPPRLSQAEAHALIERYHKPVRVYLRKAIFGRALGAAAARRVRETSMEALSYLPEVAPFYDPSRGTFVRFAAHACLNRLRNEFRDLHRRRTHLGRLTLADLRPRAPGAEVYERWDQTRERLSRTVRARADGGLVRPEHVSLLEDLLIPRVEGDPEHPAVRDWTGALTAWVEALPPGPRGPRRRGLAHFLLRHQGFRRAVLEALNPVDPGTAEAA